MKVKCSGELYSEPITREECLACARRLRRPPCGFSEPLLRALIEDDDRSKEIHVTDLTGCLKRAYRKKVDPQPEYVHEKIYKMVGKAVHAYIAQYNEEETEKPFISDGVMGTVDYQDKAGNITDFKTTRWLNPFNKLPYGAHAEQVNIYKALTGAEGAIAVQYLDVSGAPQCKTCRTVMVLKNGQVMCPTCGKVDKRNHLGALIVDVVPEDTEKVTRWVRERAEKLKAALEGGEEPDAEPSWECGYCEHIHACPVGQAFRGG